jgi:hypothetical protein
MARASACRFSSAVNWRGGLDARLTGDGDDGSFAAGGFIGRGFRVINARISRGVYLNRRSVITPPRIADSSGAETIASVRPFALQPAEYGDDAEALAARASWSPKQEWKSAMHPPAQLPPADMESPAHLRRRCGCDRDRDIRPANPAG